MPVETAYQCYDDRWLLELVFNRYKNDECLDHTNVQGDFAFIGSEFINFIAITATCRILRKARSPCRYTGRYMTDDLVIRGHNYTTHFSPIRWLKAGDDVYSEAAGGAEIHYTVSGLLTVQPTDIEEMIATQDEMPVSWDLTLFTCNPLDYFRGRGVMRKAERI